MSAATRIRANIITELEKGNYSFLPSVYVISFIKTYCKFLKISNSETELIIKEVKGLSNIKTEESQISSEPITKTETKINSETESFQKKRVKSFQTQNIISYSIYGALALAIIALLYITFFTGDGSTTIKFSNDDSLKLKGSADTTLISSNKNLTEYYESPDSILLEAKAIDTAWLRIVIDGEKSYQITMYPGNESSWSASKHFLLSIGKEGAIQFYRNGELLKPFGTKGAVIRNVKITIDNVASSSTPWDIGGDTTKKRIIYQRKKKEEPIEYPRLLEPSKIESSVKPFEKDEKK
mgnify:CR=1 FL=1